MKMLFHLYASILLLLPSAYGQKHFKFPDEISASKVYLTSIKKDIATMQSRSAQELWQFSLTSRKILFHFNFGVELEQDIYNARFKDQGLSYRKAKQVYESNDINERLCKIKSYFINDSNEIYAFVIGTEVKPAPLGKPADDISLKPFYALVLINSKNVKAIYGIQPIPEDKGYWVEETSFYIVNNVFYFTVAKEQVSPTKNYFIGKWTLNSGQLVFQDFVKLELPRFNTERGVGYGLLDFIFKNDKIIFYSNTTVYDLRTMTSKKLIINDASKANYSGNNKGEIFNFGFSVCDFHAKSNEIKLIVRRENSFYIERFKSNQFVEEIPLSNYTVKNLYRFPFYDTNGNIVVTPKETDDIILLTP